jgi:signal transduction histidine kinase/FixJ family two-component response regulator
MLRVFDTLNAVSLGICASSHHVTFPVVDGAPDEVGSFAAAPVGRLGSLTRQSSHRDLSPFASGILSAITYNPAVTVKHIPSFEAAVAPMYASVNVTYEVWKGVGTTPIEEQGDTVYPVLDVAPYPDEVSLLGLIDTTSLPSLRRTVERAVETGRITPSAPFISSVGQHLEIQLYLVPVYESRETTTATHADDEYFSSGRDMLQVLERDPEYDDCGAETGGVVVGLIVGVLRFSALAASLSEPGVTYAVFLWPSSDEGCEDLVWWDNNGLWDAGKSQPGGVTKDECTEQVEELLANGGGEGSNVTAVAKNPRRSTISNNVVKTFQFVRVSPVLTYVIVTRTQMEVESTLSQGVPYIAGALLFILLAALVIVVDAMRAKDHESIELVRASQQETEEQARLARFHASAAQRFLTTMSHELRTPLHAIVALSQLLEVTPDLPAQVGRDLAQLRASAQYLTSIVSTILDFNRLFDITGALDSQDQGPVEEYDPVACVRETMCMLVPITAESRLSLVLRIHTPMYLVRGSCRHFRQVLVNLLGNAVRYAPPVSSITLGIRHLAAKDVAKSRAGVSLRRCVARHSTFSAKVNAPAFVYITVSDSGRGVPRAKRDVIFQPFTQVLDNLSTTGSGIGLSVVRSFVRTSGGEVWVSAGPKGKGCTFHVLMGCELVEGTDAVAAPGDEHMQFGEVATTPRGGPSSVTASPQRTGCSILVVDDSELNLRICSRLLTSIFPVTVVTATDGQAAVDLAAKSHFCLLIIDMHMPGGLSGNEVATRVANGKGASATSPLVLLSADVMSTGQSGGKGGGGYQHWACKLSKPITRADLQARLSPFLRSCVHSAERKKEGQVNE